MAGKNYRFKGNESFTIREGWVNKGLFAVVENPQVFQENYGADALGVGPNMAKSIRYWMKCSGLLKENRNESILSDLGRLIYRKDPYLERDFTLWLLHSQIAKNSKMSTAWYLFYNSFSYEEFTKEEMQTEMYHLALEAAQGDEFSKKSLESDCDSILHMYLKKQVKNQNPEDKNISPFRQLGLLHMQGDVYEKKQPDFHALPKEIVWLLLSEQTGTETGISMEKLLSGENSPGRLLNLKQVLLMEFLDLLENEGKITINRTAGLNMVYCTEKKNTLEIIEEYYSLR